MRAGTIVNPAYAGGFTNINDYNNENTTDLIVRANRPLGSRLQINALAGGATRRSSFFSNSASTGGLTVPDIYNVSETPRSRRRSHRTHSAAR